MIEVCHVFVLVYQYLGGELVRNQRFKSANVDLVLLMTRADIPGATTIETNG